MKICTCTIMYMYKSTCSLHLPLYLIYNVYTCSFCTYTVHHILCKYILAPDRIKKMKIRVSAWHGSHPNSMSCPCLLTQIPPELDVMLLAGTHPIWTQCPSLASWHTSHPNSMSFPCLLAHIPSELYVLPLPDTDPTELDVLPLPVTDPTELDVLPSPGTHPIRTRCSALAWDRSHPNSMSCPCLAQILPELDVMPLPGAHPIRT